MWEQGNHIPVCSCTSVISLGSQTCGETAHTTEMLQGMNMGFWGAQERACRATPQGTDGTQPWDGSSAK